MQKYSCVARRETTDLGMENTVDRSLRFGEFKCGIKLEIRVRVNVVVFRDECASLSSACALPWAPASIPLPRRERLRRARKPIPDAQPFRLRRHSRRLAISSLKLGGLLRIILRNFRRGMA